VPQVPDDQRLIALQRLGLSLPLLALASEQWPHPAFEFRCGHPYRCYSVPDEYWPEPFLPLWECTETVIGCRPDAGGLVFLDWYLESPAPPERIARTEQGLLFWLFSYLLEDEEWDSEEAALERLRKAAVAVGFRHFESLWGVVLEHGQRPDYRERVEAAAWDILDEPATPADVGGTTARQSQRPPGPQRC
jgi:hypothetical protein